MRDSDLPSKGVIRVAGLIVYFLRAPTRPAHPCRPYYHVINSPSRSPVWQAHKRRILVQAAHGAAPLSSLAAYLHQLKSVCNGLLITEQQANLARMEPVHPDKKNNH